MFFQVNKAGEQKERTLVLESMSKIKLFIMQFGLRKEISLAFLKS